MVTFPGLQLKYNTIYIQQFTCTYNLLKQRVNNFKTGFVRIYPISIIQIHLKMQIYLNISFTLQKKFLQRNSYTVTIIRKFYNYNYMVMVATYGYRPLESHNGSSCLLVMEVQERANIGGQLQDIFGRSGKLLSIRQRRQSSFTCHVFIGSACK